MLVEDGYLKQNKIVSGKYKKQEFFKYLHNMSQSSDHYIHYHIFRLTCYRGRCLYTHLDTWRNFDPRRKYHYCRLKMKKECIVHLSNICLSILNKAYFGIVLKKLIKKMTIYVIKTLLIYRYTLMYPER